MWALLHERMQQMPLDPLRLELKAVVVTCGCWELNLDPMGEQYVPITTGAHLQPLMSFVYVFFSKIQILHMR